MERLRAPDGCPWDREQTFESIAPYTLEEAYEVADAIERQDLAHLKDELGDLLFQVVFHAQMARERGVFDFQAVAGAICESSAAASARVCRSRRALGGRAERDLGKHQGRGAPCRRAPAARRGRRRARSGRAQCARWRAANVPALMRAHKLSKRAARVGFDFEHPSQTADKVAEELAEVREAAGPHRPARTANAPVPRRRSSRRSATCCSRRPTWRASSSRRRGRAARREREIRAALPGHGGARRRARPEILELESRRRRRALWLDVKRAE